MNEKEKVVMIPISSIDDFPNHPFEVRDDEEMELLANSINSNDTSVAERRCLRSTRRR